MGPWIQTSHRSFFFSFSKPHICYHISIMLLVTTRQFQTTVLAPRTPPHQRYMAISSLIAHVNKKKLENG